MAKPKVLVTRRIPRAGMDLLEEGADVDVNELDASMPRGELLRRLRGKDGVLCMLSDRMDVEAMDASDRLRAISTYAVGYNNIDVRGAAERGIVVTNTPGVLRDATADLAWSLLMAVARRIPASDRYVREGRFSDWGPELFLGHDVHGKTIGIVGLGDIGSAVAKRARGFDMTILYHNRGVSARAAELGAKQVTLDELLRRSDFVSLHVPATKETKHLIGPRELGMMKRTAILVNASRGEVVDEAALVQALQEGRIAGAGLDVFEREPALAPGLAELENVVLTPHTGSGTFETRDRIAVMAASNLLAALRGEDPPNVVPLRQN
jgi:glyoxylate reductase